MDDLTLVKNFCSSGDKKYLLQLSKKIKNLFIDASRIAIRSNEIQSKQRQLAYKVLEVLSPFDCIKRSKTKLRPSQDKVARYFSVHDALLLVWGTGCGKTIAALTISECYLDQYYMDNVIVISPKSLIGNMKKEMVKYGGKLSDRYYFYSYEKFLALDKKNERVNCKNSLLIIDEVHNLRNFKGVKYEAVMKCAKRARKVLLLTATPMVNTIRDFVSIINLLEKRYAICPSYRGNFPTRLVRINKKDIIQIPEIYKKSNHFFPILDKSPKIGESMESYENSMYEISRYLKGKISYQSKCNSLDFPDFKIHMYPVAMTYEYYELYKAALKDTSVMGEKPEAFLHGYRKALNKAGLENSYISNKVKVALDLIGDTQSVIYSNWLTFGIIPITHLLDEKNITYAVISGKITKEGRELAVKNFNKGTKQVLVITKAGGEGIDLKGVRNIVILDPTWNPASMEQIMGRGIRYKSHVHLPLNERMVDIWNMVLVEPGVTNVKDGETADVGMYEIIKRKQRLTTMVENMLKKISI